MIIDHGTWSRYTPAQPKLELIQHNVMFASRDGPGFGEDWYEYVASKPFGDTSVVMTVLHTDTGDVVQAATFDPSQLFPAGMGVIEETQYAGNDPQGDFGGTTYNADARKIGGKFVWPEPRPTAIEARMLAVIEDLAARLEKLEKEKIDAALSKT
jgi:hypothetical protein